MTRRIKKRMKITDHRKSNIKNAFDWINFDFNKAFCRDHGFGDRPQWEIPGKVGKTRVIYRTAKPGGGEPSLRIFIDSGVYSEIIIIAKAAQKRANKIFNEWFATK